MACPRMVEFGTANIAKLRWQRIVDVIQREMGGSGGGLWEMLGM